MSSLVDEIKSRCDIVDVIGRYVDLKRAGSIYKGLCPFHSEKTPSFAVYGSKQFFNCYGCGEAGDVISFVMKIENLDFRSAAAKLAEQYGIDMDRFGFRSESRNNEIYEMNREAARFFFRQMTERDNPGLAYMKGRGLDPKTITKFGIGYAPPSWDALTGHLKKAGYEPKRMVEAGLASYNRQKDRYYDKFRNRVMFPIFNTRGKVIGFGGRDLGQQGPKYLNSPESPVFSKKNNLYGLNLTRQDINNSDCAIMVEGYMDLVSLYRHGITNVAASLGTALTEHQCQLLKRYTQNVVLAYDADAAGQKAALRGIELLHRAGIRARVLHIPDGKDPDEFVKKHGKLAFLKLVEEALPYADYRIRVVRSRHELSTSQGTVDFLKEISQVLLDLSPVEAEIYIKKISEETGISEGAIRREINESNAKNPAERRGEDVASSHIQERGSGSRAAAAHVGDVSMQKNLIRIITADPEYLERLSEYDSVFQDPSFQRIYQMLRVLYQEEGRLDLKKAVDSLDPVDGAVLEEILQSIPFPVNSQQQFSDMIGKVQRERLQQRQQMLIQMLDMMPDSQEEQSRALMDELKAIQTELYNIAKN